MSFCSGRWGRVGEWFASTRLFVFGTPSGGRGISLICATIRKVRMFLAQVTNVSGVVEEVMTYSEAAIALGIMVLLYLVFCRLARAAIYG